MNLTEASEAIKGWQLPEPDHESGSPRHGYSTTLHNVAVFRVANLAMVEENAAVVITGKVEHYHIKGQFSARIEATGDSRNPTFDLSCDCYSNSCHHVQALLDEARRERAANRIPESLARCIRHVSPLGRPDRSAPRASFALVLLTGRVTDWINHAIPISINFTGPKTSDGKRPLTIQITPGMLGNAFSTDDAARIALLQANHGAGPVDQHAGLLINSPVKEDVFETLLADGRVYVQKYLGQPAVHGEPITPEVRWLTEVDGRQRLALIGPDGNEIKHVMRLNDLWEYNDRSTVMRRLLGDPMLIANVVAGISVLPSQEKATRQHMATLDLPPAVPILPESRPIKEVGGAPVPVVKVRTITKPSGLTYPIAELVFDYQGVEVTFNDLGTDLDSDENVAVVAKGGDTFRVHFDDVAQDIAYEKMESAGLTYTFQAAPMGVPYGYVNGTAAELGDIEHFWRAMDVCEAAGMRIVVIDPVSIRNVDATAPYHTITVSSDDAFDLDVGIVVAGRRHPLADVMAGALADRRFSMQPRPGEKEGARWTIRLGDGSLIRVPLAILRSMLAPVAEWLATEVHHAGSKVRMTRIRAALLASEVDADTPRELIDLREALKRLAAIDQEPLPATSAGFVGELRHYQREGLRWLNALAAAGLGGILGDDMGLGKTLQVIAHVLHLKDTGQLDEPVLVVVPKSITSTWATACANFAPSLKLEILHGTGRGAVHQRARAADILITTYGTAIKDIAVLEQQHFALLVLDESQNVKNPRTLTAKALRRLRATRHINLTGTPLENRLRDLWSQMDMAVPGLLGSEKGFARGIASPIEKKNSAIHREALTHRIAPFLLRRTKEDVASELPPKTISTTVIELEPAQRALYETVRMTQHVAVRAAIAERGLARVGIEVLDALLKLRQVCCDPALVPMPSARKVKASAKLDALVELVQEAVDGGHRILVFSSFATMLDRIADRMKEAGIDYLMLTGKTQNRAAVVDAFQTGTVPLFLLSLKAGGVGLNLTEADTVIHYDPWWNPAAEDQATDRAHRIGQTRPVNVYRLIAKDTVEERIEDLKARKASLAEAILSGEGDAKLSWTTEDINHLFGA